ncbi:unnamed protein product, partial [Choristocarpus tenellus]
MSTQVYTDQDGEGLGGIREEEVLPWGGHSGPEDRIALWDAIARKRVDGDEMPSRCNLASWLSAQPRLFVYAGQDLTGEEAWFGAKEARSVADSYAASKALFRGDPNERIPLW